MVSKRKVLIVSRSVESFNILKEAINFKQFQSIQHVQTAIDAKHKLRSEKIDLVILQTPLPDEFGINTAREISKSFGNYIILLVKNDIYDQTVYKVSDDKIFVLSTPTNKHTVYLCSNMMKTFMNQIDLREMEIRKLRKKLSDNQKINQAKLILIESYHYSEEKAHHYLEKMAMDLSVSKVNVAQDIIDKFRGNI